MICFTWCLRQDIRILSMSQLSHMGSKINTQVLCCSRQYFNRMLLNRQAHSMCVLSLHPTRTIELCVRLCVFLWFAILGVCGYRESFIDAKEGIARSACLFYWFHVNASLFLLVNMNTSKTWIVSREHLCTLTQYQHLRKSLVRTCAVAIVWVVVFCVCVTENGRLYVWEHCSLQAH